MAITISGANNVDKILATDGVLDSISGFNVVGVMTAGTFDVTGKTTTGHLNVGSNIHIGNAGIITATTLIGNVTGNINHTSNLLLQISGSEKFRVGTSGQLGIGGANYGSAGQVLTSGGSGSAATWSTIASDKITEGNTEAEVVDTGSDGYFKVTTEGSERLRVDASGDVLIGTTDDAIYGDSSGEGIVLRGGECIDINRSGDSMLNLNRLSSDGPYINFRRDGSVKTALSTRSNAFCIDVAGSEKLRVDTSGDVLIGTTDDSVYNNSSGTGVVIRSGDCIDIARNDDNQLFLNRQSGDGYHIAFLRDGSYKSFISTRSNAFCIDVAGSERLRIDSSGHMGLGVTPNANWPTNGDFKALQIGTGACVFGRGSGDEDRGGIAVNYYHTGSAEKYIANGNAARIYLADGNIYFSNAPANSSGANAAMTLSDRMILDSNGNLNIGAAGSGNASVYARNILISGSSNRGMTIHTTDTSGVNRKCCIFFGTGTSVADMADGMLFYDHAGQYFHMSTAGAGTGVTKSSMRLAGDGTVRFDSTPTAANSISLLLKSHKARAVNDNNGILFRDSADHSQAAIYVSKQSTSNGTSDLVFSVSSGQVVTTIQGIPEKMRLTSEGYLGLGDSNPEARFHMRDTGTANANGFLFETGTSGVTAKFVIKTTDNGDQSKYLRLNGHWTELGVHNNEGFRVRNSGNNIAFTLNAGGSYQFSGSNLSDRNLKEDIETISTPTIDLIKQVSPKLFKWKNDINKTQHGGFIAQEMQPLFPKLISGTDYDESRTDYGVPDEEQAPGNPTGLAFDYDGYTAYLTKAMQELIAKVETLEAEVASLKSS